MNIQKMLEQAQKIQSGLKKKMDEFEATEFEHVYKNYVKVKIMGNLSIVAIEFLTKDIIDPEDSEMLADIIIAAINEATSATIAKKEEIKSSIAPGLGNML